MNRFFALVFLLLAGYTSFSQIRLGATTGANVTALLDKGLSEDPRYNSTYSITTAPIGFNFGWDISNKFGLQLESILSNQEQIFEIVDVAKEAIGNRKLDMQYLQIPMMMKFMGGSSRGARTNFSLGPQMSVLLDAVESMQHEGGTLQKPDDPDWQMPEGATDNGDGTYTVPPMPGTDVYTKAAGDFANMQFQIAAALGMDIDLSKHLMLTTQVRVNYSLTDMRNQDVFDAIASGNSSDIVSASANVLIGVQVGVHYVLGTTKSFRGR